MFVAILLIKDSKRDFLEKAKLLGVRNTTSDVSKSSVCILRLFCSQLLGKSTNSLMGHEGSSKSLVCFLQKWPLILSCLFLLNFVENYFWHVWLRQMKCIFTRSFEVEKGSQNWFCLHCDFDNEELKAMHWNCNVLVSLYIFKLFYESFY